MGKKSRDKGIRGEREMVYRSARVCWPFSCPLWLPLAKRCRGIFCVVT
jgi:hypothetical protein